VEAPQRQAARAASRFRTSAHRFPALAPGRLQALLPRSQQSPAAFRRRWLARLPGRFGPRRAEGTIGRGGREIEMETVNGSIELRKAR